MTILVTGATGNVGRHVVSTLAAAGHPVRALTRRPDDAAAPTGVPVVAGDLMRPDSLGSALDGVHAMFLFPIRETVVKVVDRAVTAGVRRIVVLSSGAVAAGYDTEYHYPVEQAVERSGVAWTHVRPGEFAVNTLHMWGPSIRTGRTVVDPFPDRVSAPVHERDIADVVSAALVEEGHAGRAYTLAGPTAVSHRERVAAIAAALGEEIRIERVTPAEAREFYHRQGGWAADNADFLLGFESYSGESTEPVEGDERHHDPTVPTTTVADVTGRPARDFATWARDHADDFR
ncbi:NAD(P)H-binding protein [Micromonospora ureilytica]|uniref:NAD(P)H-binding protein n=1 Tax=Micromonospora ureilytica TaxID=709868 RepID=UPI0033FF1D19